MKVLLIVKNPIDRVVSDILHEYSAAQHKEETMPEVDDIILGRAGKIVQRGISGLSLSEMVFYLSNYSLIHQMVEEVFPRENILVVNGDKIVTEPLMEIRRVESFLGLPAFFKESHLISRRWKISLFQVWCTQSMHGPQAQGKGAPTTQEKNFGLS